MYKFYYDKEKLLKGIIYCVKIEKLKDIDYLNLEEEQDIETVVYISDEPFSGYPIIEDNILRKATVTECVQLGYIKLEEGQILQDDEIVNIPKPSYQYKWNFEKLKWIPDEETLLSGQYIENDEIITVNYDIKLGYIVPTWDKEQRIWKEGATDLEIVEAQYNEYAGMDTPSTLKEMELQDPALATELINMLIELRGIIYSLANAENVSLRFKENIILPQPSEKLKEFKNKFKLTK